MHVPVLRVGVVGAALVASMAITGCTVSRLDRLHRKSERVQSHLQSEQAKTLALSEGDPKRAAKLNHLTDLRLQLSAVNIGLGTTRLIPDDKREIAYDVVQEAYDTIEWNIPLAPGERPRPMPAQFQGGMLRFDSLIP